MVELNIEQWANHHIKVGTSVEVAIEQLTAQEFKCSDITARVDPNERALGQSFACVRKFRSKGHLFPSEVVVRFLTRDGISIANVSVNTFNLSL